MLLGSSYRKMLSTSTPNLLFIYFPIISYNIILFTLPIPLENIYPALENIYIYFLGIYPLKIFINFFYVYSLRYPLKIFIYF